MLQTFAHYGSHIFIPLVVALFWYRSNWTLAFLIMFVGMLIDLDHLLANPIFDPNRCSIGFHPLHNYYALIVYVILVIPKKTRLIGLGLVIHLIADAVDCFFM